MDGPICNLSTLGLFINVVSTFPDFLTPYPSSVTVCHILNSPLTTFMDATLFPLEHLGSRTFRTFYKPIEDITDYGFCCHINVYLNFVNPKTANIDSADYSAEDYLSVPEGARNGIMGGVELTLDVESFDYAYIRRGATGFRMSLTDPRDKPLMNQDSIYVSPGNL